MHDPQTALSELAKRQAGSGTELLRATPDYLLESSRKRAKTRSAVRTRDLIMLTGLVLTFLFSICFRTRDNTFVPAETFRNLGGMVEILFRSIFDRPFDPKSVTDTLPLFAETVARIKLSAIALFSGVIICAAGAMFQTIFKNPIASPNILGVSTGVSFGNIFFVMTFQLEAASNLTMRYVYCYACSAVLVVLAFLAGKLAGKRLGKFSVEGTIIAGMIISQLGGVFVQYYQMKLQADETGLLELYTQLTNGDILYQDFSSMMIFFSCVILTLLPIVLIRYRFNAVTFDDSEMKAMGLSNGRIRAVGLLLGSLMAAVAMIHSGSIGFLSMVIPFLCREPGQTDFRRVLFNSCVLGGMMNLTVRIIISTFNSFGISVPAGVIMTLVILPIFVMILLQRRRENIDFGM